MERAFALFVASLFPGVGERMVHAQEERVRLERVAAEEERTRLQEQEESRRRDEETKAQQMSEEKGSEGIVQGEAGPSASAKGKEKAHGVENEQEKAGVKEM
jgi:hypothetical protein